MERRLVGVAVTMILVGAGTLVSGTVSMADSTGQPARSPASCPDDSGGTVDADQVADGTSVENCDLEGDVVVGTEGGAVEIPDTGVSVTLSITTTTGEEIPTLTAEVTGEGLLSVDESSSSDTPQSEGRQAPKPKRDPGDPQCTFEGYNLYPSKWYTTWDWKLNKGSIPTGTISQANATDAIRAGVTNIPTLNNDCAMVDNVSATQNYGGDTNNHADIGFGVGGYGCFAPDGASTLSFGNTPAGVLALTCGWAVAHSGKDKVVEADIEFDQAQNWTSTGGSGGCSGAYDLEANATHESGHSYGLDHIGNSTQTMYYSQNACDTKWRTLGGGDIKGLRQMY